tara:strand:- start:79182 stop:79736 length:555 start_codon:yes stop_codon:yes gene_type:complete
LELYYDLSKDDRILAVCDGWDAFGMANGGSKFATDVIGYPVWNFISGLDTRSYMNSIFFFCRSQGCPLSALYRADSPDMIRVFCMSVEPRSDDGLRLRHELVAEMPHWHEGRNLRHPRAVVQCSQCLSVQAGATWRPEPGRAFRSREAISYQVCPDCRHHLSRQIDTAMRTSPDRAAASGRLLA